MTKSNLPCLVVESKSTQPLDGLKNINLSWKARNMTDIKDFIVQSAGSLGLSPANAGKATSGLLGLIQDQASTEDSASLLQALPGAGSILQSMEAQSGGGMMGNLMGAAGGLLGGKAGGALSILSIFKGAGMDTNQASSFAGMFMDFISKNADGDLVSRILGQVPELKKLIQQ